MIPERTRPILSAPKGTSTEPPKPRSSLAQHLKDLYGKLAEAVTGKPTPALVIQRRKRRDETGRGFNLGRAITSKIRRSILRYLHSPTVYDPEAERGHAEQVLRDQMEEWTREEEQAAQDEAFSYGRAAAFDPQP